MEPTERAKYLILEREKGLEPSTSTLATRQSLQLLYLLELRGLVNYYLKMRNRILVLIALVLFPACASTAQRAAKYDQELGTWVGAAIEEVIARQGAPTRTVDLSPGKRLYVFEKSSVSSSSYRIPGSNVVDTDYDVSSCQVTFTAEKGIIKNYTWRGNACF